MTITSIDLGCIILEPVTVATDLWVTVFCIYFFQKLKLSEKSEPILRFWRWFFFTFAISTFLGAVSHGLRFYMNDINFRTVRVVMNLFIILSSYFLLRTTIESTQRNNAALFERLKTSSMLITLSIALITIVNEDFRLIKIHAGIVVLVALYGSYTAFKQEIKGSGKIAFGLALSIIPILIHSIQFSISEFFNFNDISHSIILISLYYIFMGAMENTRLDALSQV